MSDFDDFMKIKTLEKELYDTNSKLRFLERANDNLIEQKKQLKELLKECKEKLKYCVRETYELQTKIDEVLRG